MDPNKDRIMNERYRMPAPTMTWLVIALFFALVLGIVGYAIGSGQESEGPGAGNEKATVKQAVAVLWPTEGSTVSGVVTFEKTEEGVRISGEVKGLKPGKHGFHIHQYGDLRAADGTSAGGHFSPGEREHGGPDGNASHLGDLGNIEADESGVATIARLDSDLALVGAASILGRGLVVHAGADDLTSQPSGAAGPRVAVAVIGVAESPDKDNEKDED